MNFRIDLRGGHLSSFLCQEFHSDPLFVVFRDFSLESPEIPTSNHPFGTTTRVLTQSRDVIDNALIDALPLCTIPSRFDLVLTEFGISIFLSFIATVSD
jgi:hypothetical protein